MLRCTQEFESNRKLLCWHSDAEQNNLNPIANRTEPLGHSELFHGRNTIVRTFLDSC